MKYILIISMFIATLFGRDNPFSPSKDSQVGSLIIKEMPSEPLRPELLRLPIDAVRIKRITVEYQKVDGTKEKRTFEIEKPIAQDVPILVKQ